MIRSTCPECGNEGFVIDYERGEVVCARCGLVIDENIIEKNYDFNEYEVKKIYIQKNKLYFGVLIDDDEKLLFLLVYVRV